MGKGGWGKKYGFHGLMLSWSVIGASSWSGCSELTLSRSAGNGFLEGAVSGSLLGCHSSAPVP